MSDQLFAEDAAYTTHKKHKRRTSMPSAGLEPAIPAIKQPQTDAVEVLLIHTLYIFSFLF